MSEDKTLDNESLLASKSKNDNHQPTTKYYPNFDYAFRNLLKVEGGYVDDSSDSGGKTKFGITEKVARLHGYAGKMKDFPLQHARAIYKKSYWDSLLLDEVSSEKIAEELFDSAVNVGVSRTARWLQTTLNSFNANETRWSDVVVDGIVGTSTITALNSASEIRKWEDRILKGMNCLQGAFYIDLATRREKDERFIGGWYDHRVRVRRG